MDIEALVNALVGPVGLAIAASLAVIALWRQHVKADALKDDALKALTTSLPEIATALRDLTTVVKDAATRPRR